MVGLERALHNYTLEPSDTPFDLKTVPLATQPMIEQKAAGELSFLHLSFIPQFSTHTVVFDNSENITKHRKTKWM